MPRPIDTQSGPPSPEPLKRWGKAPSWFTEDEKRWWSRVGEDVMHLGTVSAADTLISALVAQTFADVEQLRRQIREDPESEKRTAVNAAVRLAADLLKQLGCTPQARRQVVPLKAKKAETHDPLDEFEQK